jgi:hypothetical protein
MRRISKDGLWSLIVLKTSDVERWYLSNLPDEERRHIDELLDRLVAHLRTDSDINRLVSLLSEVASSNAIETLERVALLF